MNELEKIARALERHPDLRAGADAALEVLRAAVSGNTRPLEAKYASWLELDEAFENVRLEQLKSAWLQKLFRLALSLAIRTTVKGGDA